MTTRTHWIIGWTPAILVGLFLILASGGPKLFMSTEGSSLQEFATQLGIWDILFYIGILEIICAILLIIPRTSTVGFVLMIGLLGGAMATGLTHPEAEGNWPFFPLLLIGILMIGAYFRNPELLARVRKLPVPAVSKLMKIVAWIAAVLVSIFHIFATVMKFVPIEPGSAGDQFAIAVGMRGLEIPLGIVQIVIVALFLWPRTATIGFILMVGYYAGALAANLSHGFSNMEAMPLYVSLALLTVSAIGRSPELLSRLLGKNMSEKI
jgi:hypothetical protein